eukprot:EC782914.1.p3 GENE.EC782914.1~~EC782914.1.p3  ORF type:complete len:57 (-),score=4.30 EC782914.1:6-176(-)
MQQPPTCFLSTAAHTQVTREIWWSREGEEEEEELWRRRRELCTLSRQMRIIWCPGP